MSIEKEISKLLNKEEKDILAQIGKDFVAARQSLGLTQKDYAELHGVEQSKIDDLEQGRKIFKLEKGWSKLDTLHSLASSLNYCVEFKLVHGISIEVRLIPFPFKEVTVVDLRNQ